MHKKSWSITSTSSNCYQTRLGCTKHCLVQRTHIAALLGWADILCASALSRGGRMHKGSCSRLSFMRLNGYRIPYPLGNVFYERLISLNSRLVSNWGSISCFQENRWNPSPNGFLKLIRCWRIVYVILEKISYRGCYSFLSLPLFTMIRRLLYIIVLSDCLEKGDEVFFEWSFQFFRVAFSVWMVPQIWSQNWILASHAK